MTTRQNEFEARLLTLWTTTRVPLTRANVMVYTKTPRGEVSASLDELVRDGLLAVDSDDDGELLWTVRGAKRPAHGLETLAEVARLARLSSEVNSAGEPLEALSHGRARGLAPSGDRKSIVASGALSFFLGPIGWLYAAPLKEALPALFLYLLAASLVPKVILIQILTPLLPISAILGMIYAWRYNRHGRRVGLVLGSSPSEVRSPGSSRRRS